MKRKRTKFVNTGIANPRKSFKSLLESDKDIRQDFLHRVIANSILSGRMSYGNTQTFGGLRDVYSAVGYPAQDSLRFLDFIRKYKRQDVAAAIINKPVAGAWKREPIVKTVGKNADDDPFREAWTEIWEGYHLHQLFQRLDKLTGLGRYGVLYMGFAESAETPLNQPLGSVTGLLYFMIYSEDNAPIKTLEADMRNPRFTLPETYGLRSILVASSGAQDQNYTENLVHWSRVIHVVDSPLEHEVYGTPRLEDVYNRLLDLEKIVGGSGEMFWQGAFPGMAFTTQEGYKLDPGDAEALDQEIQDYVHKMERYLKLQGIDVKNLAPNIADPGNHVDVQLRMICIAKDIPKRIFEGSERGELASSQDNRAWNEYLDNRRRTFCEMEILRPVIDKLIETKILPEPPEEGYEIEWPDLEATGDKDKAEIGKTRSEAIKNYASVPDAQFVISPKSFLEDIMELDPDKVERIMEELEAHLDEMLKQEEEMEDEMEPESSTEEPETEEEEETP